MPLVIWFSEVLGLGLVILPCFFKTVLFNLFYPERKDKNFQEMSVLNRLALLSEKDIMHAPVISQPFVRNDPVSDDE